MVAVLGGQPAGMQELRLLVPDSSLGSLCDRRHGRAPFGNSPALFTNEGIGLEHFQCASSCDIHLFELLRSVGILQKGPADPGLTELSGPKKQPAVTSQGLASAPASTLRPPRGAHLQPLPLTSLLDFLTQDGL